MSNTNPPTNGFKKGDPRINRRGRPKTFDALRALAISISNEITPDKDGMPATVTTLTLDGENREHVLTVAESILRSWANSSKPELQKAFVEIAFGKVPNPVEVTGKDGGPIEVAAPLTDEERARRVKALLENGD